MSFILKKKTIAFRVLDFRDMALDVRAKQLQIIFCKSYEHFKIKYICYFICIINLYLKMT
jgi:hypothetical protein